MLTGTKQNKSISSPFCNKGWLLLLTLKAIQFPNHEPDKSYHQLRAADLQRDRVLQLGDPVAITGTNGSGRQCQRP